MTNHVFAEQFTNINVRRLVEEANIVFSAYRTARLNNNQIIDIAERVRKDRHEDSDHPAEVIWLLVQMQAFENQVRSEDPENCNNVVQNGGF